MESIIENLKKIGTPKANSGHVLLRTAGNNKTNRRNAVKENHEVLLYVGDNLIHNSEDYAGRTRGNLGEHLVKKNEKELFYNYIMLHNPTYGDWESAIYNKNFSLSDEENKDEKRNSGHCQRLNCSV